MSENITDAVDFPPMLRALAVVTTLALSACGGGGGGGGGASSSGSGSTGSGSTTIAAALPTGDHITFAAMSLSLAEADRHATLQVARTGSGIGDVSVSYRFNEVSATAGSDFIAQEGVLTWADGDTSDRSIAFHVESDLEVEAVESFNVELFNVDGAETLGVNHIVPVELRDSACDGRSVSTISSDTNWSNACYLLDSSVVVNGDAQLSIAAGTTVIAEAGVSLTVSDTASINTVGTDALPVSLRGANATAGYWQGVKLISSNALNSIVHTTIADAEVGIEVVNSSGLSAFSNNRILRTSDVAIRLPLHFAEQIDSSTEFADGASAVQLMPKTVQQGAPVTVPAVATHYLVASNLNVDGQLSLDPGVEMHFGPSVKLFIGANGSLNAVGTEAQQIQLRGQTAMAGFWAGVQWVGSTSVDNRLEYVTVSHGGSDAALFSNLFISGAQSRLVIKNSRLTDSLGYGLFNKDQALNVVVENVTYDANVAGDVYTP